MPIRRRGNANYAPVVDNVVNTRLTDRRGSFDPKRSPFNGSSLPERICGEDATPQMMHAVMGALSHGVSQAGRQHAPGDMNTQDALACLRIMDNPGWNVELVYRNRVRSPLTAIRGFCVLVCKAGSPKAVSYCTQLTCPLWPFRMGKHGLR